MVPTRQFRGLVALPLSELAVTGVSNCVASGATDGPGPSGHRRCAWEPGKQSAQGRGLENKLENRIPLIGWQGVGGSWTSWAGLPSI